MQWQTEKQNPNPTPRCGLTLSGEEKSEQERRWLARKSSYPAQGLETELGPPHNTPSRTRICGQGQKRLEDNSV